MQLLKVSRQDASVKANARRLANSLLDSAHDDVVFIDDAVALTGLNQEDARAALVYLAVKNAGRPLMVDGRLAFDFDSMSRDPDALDGPIARALDGIGKYVFQLGASQISYLLGMAFFIGPLFLGVAAYQDGVANQDLLYLLGGGTLAFGAAGAIFSVFLRSITVFLPVLIVLGVALGWERWTLGDFQWLPVLFVIAFAMQVETLMRYKKHGFKHAFRHLFWGKGIVEQQSKSQKVTQLIVSQGGVVTLGDLMKTFGWTVHDAGEEITEILFEYGGEIEVDANGRLVLKFEDLSFSAERHAVPMPAFREETHAPALFAGLDVKWIVIIGIAAIIGFLTSPFNSVYREFVTGVDFTIEGIGLYARLALGALFSVPPVVYAYRFFENIADQAEFKTRRAFLDKMAYAYKFAKGSYVDPSHFSTEELMDLNAEFDVENVNTTGEMWVSFPEFDESPSPQTQNVSSGVVFSSDTQSQEPAQHRTEEQHVHAFRQQNK